MLRIETDDPNNHSTWWPFASVQIYDDDRLIATVNAHVGPWKGQHESQRAVVCFSEPIFEKETTKS